MSEEQKKLFTDAINTRKESADKILRYWNEYSSFNDWQFWFMVALFIIPIVILLIKLDKEKAFMLGFYGFSIHIFYTYINAFAFNLSWWNYNYQTIPFLPSVALDSSFVPVTFMLVYQWTMNKNKNYYLYTSLMIIFHSFVMTFILKKLGIINIKGIEDYLQQLLAFIVVIIISKTLTALFYKFEKRKEII